MLILARKYFAKKKLVDPTDTTYPETTPDIEHGTIIRTGITCKKTPCYMRESACKWFIVKNAKILLNI